MSRKRSYQERIDELMKRKNDCDEKSKQLNAQMKELEKKKSEQERKVRTRRLVRTGSVAETVLGRAIEGDEDLDRFKKFLLKQEDRGRFFSKAMNPPDSAEPEVVAEASHDVG